MTISDRDFARMFRHAHAIERCLVARRGAFREFREPSCERGLGESRAMRKRLWFDLSSRAEEQPRTIHGR
jgi:hypothetical protein